MYEAENQAKPQTLEEYSPFDPQTLSCPHAAWAMLRRESPIHQVEIPDVEIPVFFVTRRSDIEYICERPEVFSNHPPATVWRWGDFEPEIADAFAKSGYKVVQTLATADPPDAQRYRKIAEQFLSAPNIREMEPTIKENIEHLCDQFPEGEVFNFVESYSIPLPLKVICLILGLPYSDADFLLHYTEEFTKLVDPTYPKERAVQAADAVADGYKYLAEQVLVARETPATGLLSAYANARFPDGTPFDIEESISMTSQSVVAGNETTRNALSSTAFVLADREDLWQRLKADRGLVRDFVEESLRLNAPATATARSVMKATEVNGIKIPKGSAIFIIWGSGSHDENEFANPQVFDMDRKRKAAHTTFGMGLHRCAGMHLARAELRLSVAHWLENFESMRLAVPAADIHYEPKFGFRALDNLPIVVKRA